MTHPLHGWVRQPYDHRDFHFRAPQRVLEALAPTTDLAGKMGPNLNQAGLGACGPHSAAENIDYEENVAGMALIPPSRLFIYYNTRALMGSQYINQDSGVDNRSMMKALANYGWCPETLWPYADDPQTFKKKPSQACYDAAIPNKISNYVAVPQILDQMQAALAGGNVFIFGFSVYNQLMSDEAAATGIVKMPAGSSIGGHDVTICGYTTVERPGVKPGNKWPAGTFKARNHWVNGDGSVWGDCLAGDTRIALLNGTKPTIQEIFDAGEDVWVYSVDERTHKIVPAKARPVFSGTRRDLVRVGIDTGEMIVCTRDHPWMLRNGTFKRAAELAPGDSLMPFYTKDDRGYERFLAPTNYAWITTHWTVAHDQELRDCMDGHTPECRHDKCRLVVHHYNFNERDNTPENLRVMFACRHTALHKQLADSDAKSEQMRKRWKRDRDKLLRTSIANIKKYNEDLAAGQVGITEKQLSARRKNIRSAIAAMKAAFAKNGPTEAQRAARRKNIEVALASRGLKRKTGTPTNHKVSSVAPSRLVLPTFDLKVQRPHCHNFALAAGVFVHNSGYMYIPFAYATSSRYASDFWAINALPTPPTPPAPPTPPTPSPAGLTSGTYSVPSGATIIVP